jgi:Tfp pilus assembly protein FimT
MTAPAKSSSSTRGFSTIELLIAAVVMVIVILAVFGVARASPDAYAVDSETADMHQRLRVAHLQLVRDLAVAQAIRPYRAGGSSPDPPGTFKPDTITASSGSALHTYWLKRDDAAAVYQLMSYAGGVSMDVPVVDNVVALAFEYFGDPRPPDPRLPMLAPGVTLVPLDPALFVDGPWNPDDASVDRWDADLLRIRAVGVTLRVQAAAATLRGPAGVLFAHAGTATAARRWAPDIEVRFQAAPRNMNPGT